MKLDCLREGSKNSKMSKTFLKARYPFCLLMYSFVSQKQVKESILNNLEITAEPRHPLLLERNPCKQQYGNESL